MPLPAPQISVGLTHLPPTGADSTAVLLAALANASGKSLDLVPDAVYGVNAQLMLTATNATINGHGATLKAMPTFAPTTYGNLLVAQACNNIVINDLNFDGNRTQRGISAGGGASVLGNWSRNLKLIGCGFKDAPLDHVMLWGGANAAQIVGSCRNVSLLKCTFKDGPGRNHVSMINVRGLTIDSCAFGGTGINDPKSCIDGEPDPNDPFGCCADLTITNSIFVNVFRAVSNWNIAGTGCTGFIFAGNTISNATQGVVNQWAYGEIRGNKFFNVASPILTGSYALSSMPVWIDGNTFDAKCGPLAIDTTHDVVAA